MTIRSRAVTIAEIAIRRSKKSKKFLEQTPKRKQRYRKKIEKTKLKLF